MFNNLTGHYDYLLEIVGREEIIEGFWGRIFKLQKEGFDDISNKADKKIRVTVLMYNQLLVMQTQCNLNYFHHIKFNLISII